MKYFGKITNNKDLVTKEYVDNYTLFPDFDAMTPSQVIEYDSSTSGYKELGYRVNNNISSLDDVDDLLLFRVTITGTNIWSVTDFYVKYVMELSFPCVYWINYKSASGALSGFYTLRLTAPKVLNNGVTWGIQYYQYNTTARHIKIDIYKTTDNFVWNTSLTAGNVTNKNYSTKTIYNYSGIGASGWQNIDALNSQISNYSKQSLLKFTETATINAGETIIANSVAFIGNNGKIYNASNKTVAINPESGIMLASGAANSGANIAYQYIKQKGNWSNINANPNITHETVALGTIVYLRCTIDSNNEIHSDAYVDTQMRPGYTWIYLGVAQSASTVNFDSCGAQFYTLSSNGNLTHINGHPIGS